MSLKRSNALAKRCAVVLMSATFKAVEFILFCVADNDFDLTNLENPIEAASDLFAIYIPIGKYVKDYLKGAQCEALHANNPGVLKVRARE
jgi:hypothetical protein